jgi:hypothetical protein
MVLSSEERVFLVEYVFREGNRYTDLVQEQFAEKFPNTAVPHRNAVRKFTDKFRETAATLILTTKSMYCSQVHSDVTNALYFAMFYALYFS